MFFVSIDTSTLPLLMVFPVQRQEDEKHFRKTTTGLHMPCVNPRSQVCKMNMIILVWTLGQTWGKQFLEYVLFIILELLDNISATGYEKDKFPECNTAVLKVRSVDQQLHPHLGSGWKCIFLGYQNQSLWGEAKYLVYNMFCKWHLCTSKRKGKRLVLS